MSSELRRHWDLDPNVTFLDHGAFGAVPRAVLEYQTEFRARIEANPARFFARELGAEWDAARRRAAEFVGADSDGFVFVTNATTGVNTALRALELGAGDELLVTDHEYNPCRNALNDLARATGATVSVVELPFPLDSPDEIVDALERAMSDATRVLLVDHVTSQTGLVLPIASIGALCRERDVTIVVDGAHAPGMADLDVASLGVDFYTGNFHKWVCTPKSAAFLWIAPEHRDRTRPLVVSHGASMPAESVARRLHNEFDWQGTIDPTPVLSIPFTVEYMASIVDGGWPEIRRRNRDLALQAREVLNDAVGADLLAPPEMIGSLATVRLPDGDASPQASSLYLDPHQDELLFEHGIEVRIVPWPRPPQRLLRISSQVYNSLDDYRRLAEVLPDVLSSPGSSRR